MPGRFLLRLFAAIFGYLFLAVPSVFAGQLVINEFLANSTAPGKEWVEFYNPEHVDLSAYWLDDDISFATDSGNSSKKSLSGLNLSNPDFPYLEFSSFLNNDGDYVILFSNDGVIIDQYQYQSNPGKNVSLGRSPDGGQWAILSATTLGSPNSSPVPSPAPASSENTQTSSPPPPADEPAPVPETPPDEPSEEPAQKPDTIPATPTQEPEINLVLGTTSAATKTPVPTQVPESPESQVSNKPGIIPVAIVFISLGTILSSAALLSVKFKIWEKWPIKV